MNIFLACLLIIAVFIIGFLIDIKNTLAYNLERTVKNESILMNIINERYGEDEFNKIYLEYSHKIIPIQKEGN